MRRQLHQTPSHLKVASGPVALPQRYLGAETVVVNHYAGTEKLIPAIPGFRTSAAFLTSLSANLRIDPDLPSPLGTPINFRTSSTTHAYLPPPSPLSFSTLPQHSPYAAPTADQPTMSTEPTSTASAAAPPAHDLPQLRTYTAETEDDRIDGLRLIADSVAQQRQTASKMLILHPLHLAAFAAFAAALTHRLWKTNDDLYLLGPTLGGVLMACLLAVRWATQAYLALAEEIDWAWLGGDRMIVVKWGEEVIGALVLGWADGSSGAEGAAAGKKKGAGRRGGRKGKAVVRAWTVRLKYRGKGVGEGLLEEAVRSAGERGAEGIVFEREHANSKRVLPAFYNGFLDHKEAKAEKALEKVADEKGNFRQRRSSPTWGSR